MAHGFGKGVTAAMVMAVKEHFFFPFATTESAKSQPAEPAGWSTAVSILALWKRERYWWDGGVIWLSSPLIKIDRIQTDLGSGFEGQNLDSPRAPPGPVLSNRFSLVVPEEADRIMGEVETDYQYA